MQHITADRYCEKCEKEMRCRLVRNIASNGVSQVYWICMMGAHGISKRGAKFISHEKIRSAGFDPNDLPVIENYGGYNICAVCGDPLTEYNHWAPRFIFGADAERWPGDYLCKAHHDEWHARVTPNMTGVKHA